MISDRLIWDLQGKKLMAEVSLSLAFRTNPQFQHCVTGVKYYVL